MNINEYIKKYITIEDNGKGELSVSMSVPPMKIVEWAWQEGVETKRWRINQSDIKKYLDTLDYENLSTTPQPYTIDNKHPRGLKKTWVFKYKKTKSRKRKTSSEK